MSKTDHFIDGWLCRHSTITRGRTRDEPYVFVPTVRRPTLEPWDSVGGLAWVTLGSGIGVCPRQMHKLLPPADRLKPGEGPVRVRIRMEVLTP